MLFMALILKRDFCRVMTSKEEKLTKIKDPILRKIFLALEGKKARNTSGI